VGRPFIRGGREPAQPAIVHFRERAGCADCRVVRVAAAEVPQRQAKTTMRRNVGAIEHYNSFHNGYIMTKGGDGRVGFKQREAIKSRCNPAEYFLIGRCITQPNGVETQDLDLLHSGNSHVNNTRPLFFSRQLMKHERYRFECPV
jgi:hypothetical protein